MFCSFDIPFNRHVNPRDLGWTPDLPPEQAMLLGCGVMTGVGAALNTAGVEAGSSVAVFGTGGVGLSTVQVARLAGATEIVAVDVVPEKLGVAEEVGATTAVDAADEDRVERIRAVTGSVDYAFDAVGRPAAQLAALRCRCCSSAVDAGASAAILRGSDGVAGLQRTIRATQEYLGKVMWNPLRWFLYLCAGALARLGVIDRIRGERSVELAWPRILTGFARQSKRTVDLMMLGFVVGPSAVAGLGFAYTYWFIIAGVGLGTAGGTVSLVSQRYGAEKYGRIDLVIKQSLWVVVLLSIPLTITYWGFADELIGLLGAPPSVRRYGATYLQVLSLGIFFQFANHIASRTLIGADDAWTPMAVRVGGASLNIVSNAVLIFGFGLGVVGAALGTLSAMMLVTACFAWGFVYGSIPVIGTFPVQVQLGPPYFDWGILRQLVEIAFPLVVRRVGGGAAQFPLIALVAQFGTVIVAAYTVSRQLRGLMRAPNWGFGLASSSLVGQELGADNEREAEAYGWDILRFSLMIHVITAALVAAFARPIARLFIHEPGAVIATIPFIWVAALAVLGEGIDGAATGPLRAGGDTQWPMYGRLLGRYGTIPLVYLGTVTPLGLVALYGALVLETFLPAGVTYYRFQTGKWKAISRSYRPGTTD